MGQLPCALEQKLIVESFSWCLPAEVPPGQQLWHIWSSGRSSCVRPGCRRWLPLSNAVLQCFSFVLWPHLHVGMGISRIRHVNCWIQLAKLHKFLYMHTKVHHWDLHSKDHCCVLMELWGLEKGSVVTQQSPKSSFATADLLQLPKDKVWLTAFLMSSSLALLHWFSCFLILAVEVQSLLCSK